MKHYSHIAIAASLLLLAGCWEKREKPVVETPYEPVVSDVQGTVRDTILTGCLGEETGMSSLQIITDACDTLSISKTTSDGVEGKMLGEVRNYEDRVMVVANMDEDENLFLTTFLNISQLEGKWKSGQTAMELRSDSTVRSRGVNYKHWRVERCKLLLSGEQTTEYGVTQRVDTVQINLLNEDSLHITTHRHGVLKLGK